MPGLAGRRFICNKKWARRLLRPPGGVDGMRPCRPSSLLHGPRGVFLLTKYHLPFAPPPTGTRTSGSQPRDGALPSYPGCALPKPFPPFPPRGSSDNNNTNERYAPCGAHSSTLHNPGQRPATPHFPVVRVAIPDRRRVVFVMVTDWTTAPPFFACDHVLSQPASHRPAPPQPTHAHPSTPRTHHHRARAS